MSKCVAFFTGMFIVSAALGNGKTFPGYYVDNQGDTVKCGVYYRDWKKNPKTIQVETNSGMKTLGVGDIRGFGVTGICDYRTATVSYHPGNINGTGLPAEYTDSTVVTTVFLKLLAGPDPALFDLSIPGRTYYFFSLGNDGPKEFVFRMRERDGSVQEDPQYKDQMLSILAIRQADQTARQSTRTMRYNQSDFLPLFRKLNGQQTVSRRVGNSPGTRAINLDLMIGAVQISNPTSFYGNYHNSYQFDKKITGSFGLNLIYAVPGRFNSLRFGFSASYLQFKKSLTQSGIDSSGTSAAAYTVRKFTETPVLKASMLQSTLYVMYIINPTDPVKGYIKAGIRYSLGFGTSGSVVAAYSDSSHSLSNGVHNSYSTHSGVNTLVRATKALPMFDGAIGIASGRHRLELEYCPQVETVSRTEPTMNESFKFGTAGVYYFFSLFSVK